MLFVLHLMQMLAESAQTNSIVISLQFYYNDNKEEDDDIAQAYQQLPVDEATSEAQTKHTKELSGIAISNFP